MPIFRKKLPRAPATPLILWRPGSRWATLAHALAPAAADAEGEGCRIGPRQANFSLIPGAATQENLPGLSHGPAPCRRFGVDTAHHFTQPNNRSPPCRQAGNHPSKPANRAESDRLSARETLIESEFPRGAGTCRQNE